MSFGLILIFMFLVFWRPQDWLWPALQGWPILDVIFYFSLLGVLLEVSSGRLRFPRRSPQMVMLAGLFVAAIASHLPHTYLQGIIDTFPVVLKVCFFTVVLIIVLDSPVRLRRVALLFVVMACVMAIHALMQEHQGYGFADARPLRIRAFGDKPAYTRSIFFGIFEDPNDLAQFLATSIPFAFVIRRKRSFVSLLLALGVTGLLVAGLLATHSRGGQLALIVVSGLILVQLLPDRWFPVGMGAVLVGFILACPMSAPYMDASARDRVDFWGLANQSFKANPIFGLGYGMFWQVAEDRAAHNAFVFCYTEMGLLGYWFWFGLLAVGIAGAWRARKALNRRGDPEEQWLRRFATMGIAAISGFCASGYFLSRTFMYPLFFLFAVLAAVPLVAESMLKADHPPLLDMRRDIFQTALISSLVSVVYIYVTILLINQVS